MDNRNPRMPILLADDENDVLQSYKMTLRFAGINNFTLCSDSRTVASLLSSTPHCIAVLDLSMPHVTGHDILKMIKEEYPEMQVIIVTAQNNVATAVDCMKAGAVDYMIKPIDDNRFLTSVKNAVELFELQNENKALRQNVFIRQLRNPDAFSSILTISDSMHSIFSYIEAIAPSPKPVLVTGESGSGKELIAQALHKASGRAGKFVAVNVAGLEDTVFSDTLFGHRKGAFTGADTERKGLIEEATGGTLFLDEIGSLEKQSQIKLLRLLQENQYFTLGSDVAKKSQATVVAATNEDLQAKMKDGTFRNDLYYRLISHQILLPPLRERREDIPILVGSFLKQAAANFNKEKPEITPEILRLLQQYLFPGNVRELQALIFDAVGRSAAPVLDIKHFKDYIARETGVDASSLGNEPQRHFAVPYYGEFPQLKEVEEYLVNEAMKKAEGSQYRAAELLGVAQSTLWRRFKK
jgi:DNA-binding NtrC family response regulator